MRTRGCCLLWVLVAGLSVSTMAGQAQENTPVRPRQITVTGYGEVKRKPDLAFISAGIVATDVSLAKARERAAAKMQAAFRVLSQAGVNRDEIETTGVHVYSHWSDQAGPLRRGKHVGAIVFRVINGIGIRTAHTSGTGRILDALVHVGLNDISGPSFMLKDDQAARVAALEAAYRDARAKADRLAQSAGYSVTSTERITEAGAMDYDGGEPGGPPMPQSPVASLPPIAAYRASVAMTPIRSGDVIVTAGLTATFRF